MFREVEIELLELDERRNRSVDLHGDVYLASCRVSFAGFVVSTDAVNSLQAQVRVEGIANVIFGSAAEEENRQLLSYELE